MHLYRDFDHWLSHHPGPYTTQELARLAQAFADARRTLEDDIVVEDEDDDIYPSDVVLRQIRDWPYQDFPALMDFVKSHWRWAETGWVTEGHLHKIATGGWSGNESLVHAMASSPLFWTLCFQMSRRGGYYEFLVEPLAK